MSETPREQKVDLISDVVLFVKELNEVRHSGDSLLDTLARQLQGVFIHKEEQKEVPTVEEVTKKVVNSHQFMMMADKVSKMQGIIDSNILKVNKVEQMVNDHEV